MAKSDTEAPEILIVGAGAVGQVFGLHLQNGGASVSYLVRSESLASIDKVFRLYRLGRRHPPTPVDFTPNAIFSDPMAVGSRAWDSVWLCIPSTALDGRWMAKLRDRTGTASIVTLGQNLDDRAKLEHVWPREQIVEVTPNVFAYDAMLQSEPLPQPGIVFWIPWAAAFEIAGTQERTGSISSVLTAGGLRTKYVGLQGKGALAAALMIPYFLALEANVWSISRLRGRLRLPAAVAREATRAVAARCGVRPPGRLVTTPLMARIALAALERMAPFEFNRYLLFHARKISAQSRQMLDSWIAEARIRKLPTSNLERLRRALAPTLGMNATRETNSL
jgi:hypothetical protein